MFIEEYELGMISPLLRLGNDPASSVPLRVYDSEFIKHGEFGRASRVEVCGRA